MNSFEEFQIRIQKFAEYIDCTCGLWLIAAADRSGAKENAKGRHVRPVAQLAHRNLTICDSFKRSQNRALEIDLITPTVNKTMKC